jgi:hypothetical protein
LPIAEAISSVSGDAARRSLCPLPKGR